MYDLASGDPAAQAEIYADASAAAALTPDTASRLRFALVLATPGHAGSDPERAQAMLRELLSQPDLLTPMERSLAWIHLRDVEERLVLGNEARRLREENSQTARTEQAAIEQRIAAVEAENRKLKQSLAEAQEKLDAITNIERSIREQSDNPGATNDNSQR
jgi:FtsZ-binding cell division protein ZapB